MRGKVVVKVIVCNMLLRKTVTVSAHRKAYIVCACLVHMLCKENTSGLTESIHRQGAHIAQVTLTAPPTG